MTKYASPIKRPGFFEPPTDAQRGLYWVWMQEIGAQLELTKEEAHESFKGLFLEPGFSTMHLHTVMFEKYLDQVAKWCGENGVTLPEPKD